MKSMQVVVLMGVTLGVHAIVEPAEGAPQVESSPVVGRWNLTVADSSGNYPSWLEVRQSGFRTLVGRFVGKAGSARPISEVGFSDNVLRFSIPPQWEAGDNDLQVEGVMDDDNQLSGWLVDPAGNRAAWTATRAPALRRASPPTWGAPIVLFDGTDMASWQAFGESQWRIDDGELTNVAAGANLISRQTFTDFKLHVEFRYPSGANSGVYLRGRYEVQILDTRGLEPANDHLGAIYGFLAPSEDHASEAGEWQSIDITLVGRLVTVAVNGKTVISNREIPGITGGALDSDEVAPGPLILQGDHGPVKFRNIVLTPAK